MSEHPIPNESDRTRLALLSILEDERLARQEWKKTEDRLRLSTELAGVAVWEYDLTTNTMSRSANHDSLYGLEWQKKWDLDTFSNAIHPDDRNSSIRIIQQSASSGGPDKYAFDFRVIFPDQSVHCLNLIGQVVERNSNGECILMRGCIIDITQRKAAENTIRANEARLWLFVEHSPAAIAMFDREMNYIIASRRYLSDYDLGDQDLIGRSHYEVFPEMPERWKEIHRRCLAGTIEKADEDPFPRASGKVDWIRWEIHPWYEESGEIAGIILFSEVITENIESRQALQKAEEKFSRTFRLSPDIITLTSMKDGCIVDANEHTFRITGYGPDELIGRDTSALGLWVDPDARNRYISTLEKEGRVHNFEARLRMRSGEIKTMLLSGEQIAIGLEDYIVGVFHDITDLKQGEELLRSTMNRLIQAEEDLRRTAAQQLHDQVGQNLSALILNLSFIRGQIPPGLAESTGKRLTDSLALLEDTIDRIRDIMTDLRPSILDDYGLFAALKWSAETFTERTRISVALSGSDLSNRLPQEVEYALYRMTQEALHNVIKHAEATRVYLDLKEDQEWVRLTIRDDGVGFDMEEGKREEGRGKRGEGRGKREEGRGKRKGFGLMNITQRMKALGGRCEIRSAPGEGTTVTMRIRRA